MLLKLSSIFLHFFSLPIITMYFRRTGKYLKQRGHWRCLGFCPICPPDSFFQQGQKPTISNFRGGILSGGGICTLCPTAAYASEYIKCVTSYYCSYIHAIEPKSFRKVKAFFRLVFKYNLFLKSISSSTSHKKPLKLGNSETKGFQLFSFQHIYL